MLTEEEERAVEQAALANSQMRGLLGTDRPRVVSVTVEPNKSEAGAYLAGVSVATPSRRITIVLFNAEGNRAGQVILAIPSSGQPHVLEVQRLDPADVPFGPEDARTALDLAKSDPAVRRAVGDVLDRFELLDPGSDARPPYAAQVLPLRTASLRDPCTSSRCLDIIFRTENGYLSVRPTVNLTRRTLSLGAVPVQGGHRP